MTILRIPDLLGAISQMETGVHPDEIEVTRASNEWLASYNFLSQSQWNQMLKMKYGLCAARVYPVGDKNRLRVAADWIQILFNYDDLLDDSTSNLTRDESGTAKASDTMLSVLNGTDSFHPTPSLPVAAAFHRHVGLKVVVAWKSLTDVDCLSSMWTRFLASSTPIPQKRFIDAFTGFTMAATKQSGIREHQTCQSVEEYIALRRETGAVKVIQDKAFESKITVRLMISLKTFLSFIEYILEIDVPDKAWHHPIIESLIETANDIIAWGNDVTSFNREQAAGDHQNLVAVVSATKDIPVQVAMEYVFFMYQWAVNRWFELRSKTPKFDPETDEIVSKYIRGVEQCISGLTHWYFETERYFGPQHLEVKDKRRITLLPLEPSATEPVQKLKYAIF